MGKSKSAAQAVAAAPAKVLNGVKGGKVSKPVKSKDISKSSVIKKEIEKSINKAPSPADDSSDDSSSSESESGSDDESDASESEVVPQKSKVNGVNGVKKVAKDDSSSEEDSDSDSDDSDDAAPAVKANGVKATTTTVAAAAEDSDSDSDSSDGEDSVADPAARFQPDSDASDSEEDSDDSASDDSASDDEDEAPVAKTNGAAKAAAEAADNDDDDEDESEDDSEEGSSSEEEEEKPKVEAKKRKADEPAEISSKKTKVADAADESGASKTLFVGHLSWGVDEDGLYKEFESFGDIASCKIMYHQDSGKSKGFGYVEFSDIANAIAAKNAMHEKMIDGREVNIDFATPRVERPRPSGDERAKKYGDVESAPSDTIFVGNISFDATYDHIKEAFEQYGTITRISLPTDRESGNPKGFGYVGFSSVEEATEALNALKGADIAGRQVRLDFAQARADDGGQRGGRGGGRGGFDRGGRGGGRGFGGGRGGGRGGFDRGGRGGGRGFGGGRGGGRGGSSFNRGGFGDFAGKKTSF